MSKGISASVSTLILEESEQNLNNDQNNCDDCGGSLDCLELMVDGLILRPYLFCREVSMVWMKQEDHRPVVRRALPLAVDGTP